MAPPLSSLYTTSFLLAALLTFLVGASLRILAILPYGKFRTTRSRKRAPLATRVLIVLGSGGHTHEMFYLLRDLDTRKYTHRTYVVSSGDAFSAQRAAEFERELEDREKKRATSHEDQNDMPDWNETPHGNGNAEIKAKVGENSEKEKEERPACIGPDHYNIAIIPRARQIHQPLLTTPFSCLYTLISSFPPLLSSPALLQGQPSQTPYEASAQDLPDLIITNGPATAVIVILASLLLRFFNIKGAESRNKCKSVYVESFARVTSLSLSGKLLLRVVDRFLVQWEELEGKGGRAEFWGVLV